MDGSPPQPHTEHCTAQNDGTGFAFGNIGSTLAWNKFLNVAMWVGLALLAAGAGAAVWKKKDRKLRRRHVSKPPTDNSAGKILPTAGRCDILAG